MLPTDMALIQDPIFKKHVEVYARNEEEFFDDFSDTFAKLTSMGCDFNNDDTVAKVELDEMEQNSKDFREYAMHGSVDRMREIYKTKKSGSLRAGTDLEAISHAQGCVLGSYSDH